MPALDCRHCGKPLRYERISDLPHFPFCSKKCKLLDLGEWLDEEHRIPGEPGSLTEYEVQEKKEDSEAPKNT